MMAPKLSNPALFITKESINYEWLDLTRSRPDFPVLNPSTGDTIALLPDMDAEDVTHAAKHSSTAFQSWKSVSPKARGKIIRKWAELILSNASDLATLITLENGKPFPEARGEVMAAAAYLEFYAGEAERVYGDVIPSAAPSTRSFAIKQPIGVVACLTPWNLPFAMIARKAGGAIAAGCATIIKPAGETPFIALAMGCLGKEAGVPSGVFNVVLTMGNLTAVGKALCEDPIIRKISFTGSTPVGKLLMQQSAGTLKKLSLELGGNAPCIVFEDCDIESALETVLVAKLRNAGQTCISPNRIFVERAIYEEWAGRMVEVVKGFKVGDGFVDGIRIGPLTVPKGVEKAERHVDDAVSKGARLLLGGKPMPGKGNFFEPTVITDMTSEMLSYEEESFAPIAQLYLFDTEEQAIDMANNSDVGLGSYICTKDIARMWRVAEKLETGMVGVNTAAIASGELPFGGVKQSGFGREGGKWGVEEFMTTKLVTVAVPAA
jgi:succinate-semialdehyde dehydrogenase/glutarate-semialdehyde dehydrogenase